MRPAAWIIHLLVPAATGWRPGRSTILSACSRSGSGHLKIIPGIRGMPEMQTALPGPFGATGREQLWNDAYAFQRRQSSSLGPIDAFPAWRHGWLRYSGVRGALTVSETLETAVCGGVRSHPIQPDGTVLMHDRQQRKNKGPGCPDPVSAGSADPGAQCPNAQNMTPSEEGVKRLRLSSPHGKLQQNCVRGVAARRVSRRPAGCRLRNSRRKRVPRCGGSRRPNPACPASAARPCKV